MKDYWFIKEEGELFVVANSNPKINTKFKYSSERHARGMLASIQRAVTSTEKEELESLIVAINRTLKINIKDLDKSSMIYTSGRRIYYLIARKEVTDNRRLIGNILGAKVNFIYSNIKFGKEDLQYNKLFRNRFFKVYRNLRFVKYGKYSRKFVVNKYVEEE